MKIQDAKAELKELAGGRYHSISYRIIEYSDREIQYETGVYIDGSNWKHAPTFRQAIDSLKTEMGLIVAPVEEPQDIDDQPQAAAN